jgi:hypothetical protein
MVITVPLTKEWSKTKLEALRKYVCKRASLLDISESGTPTYWWIAIEKDSRPRPHYDFDQALYCQYEDLPLFINVERSIPKIVVQWRLEQGE